LIQFRGDVSLVSFCPEGFIGIGVPIGTHGFVRNFVSKTCRDIIDDVEKLDVIQDDLTQYELLRFCQGTHLQYTYFHILIANRYVLQQHHVDCKIGDTLLKKGAKEHTDELRRLGYSWEDLVTHGPLPVSHRRWFWGDF
jgi:hypothetical protein